MKKKQKTVEPNDRAFLNDPAHWPNWPYQTLRRRKNQPGGGFECSVLFNGGGNEFKWSNVNFFSLGAGVQAVWEDTTIDKILTDGWEVD